MHDGGGQSGGGANLLQSALLARKDVRYADQNAFADDALGFALAAHGFVGHFDGHGQAEAGQTMPRTMPTVMSKPRFGPAGASGTGAESRITKRSPSCLVIEFAWPFRR